MKVISSAHKECAATNVVDFCRMGFISTECHELRFKFTIEPEMSPDVCLRQREHKFIAKAAVCRQNSFSLFVVVVLGRAECLHSSEIYA
jgi:hypothetical protein